MPTIFGATPRPTTPTTGTIGFRAGHVRMVNDLRFRAEAFKGD